MMLRVKGWGVILRDKEIIPEKKERKERRNQLCK